MQAYRSGPLLADVAWVLLLGPTTRGPSSRRPLPFILVSRWRLVGEATDNILIVTFKKISKNNKELVEEEQTYKHEKEETEGNLQQQDRKKHNETLLIGRPSARTAPALAHNRPRQRRLRPPLAPPPPARTTHNDPNALGTH